MTAVIWQDLVALAGIWVVVMILHELGHAIAAWLVARDIGWMKLHWWGMEFRPLHPERIVVGQDFVMRWGGIFLGYVAFCGLIMMTSTRFQEVYTFLFLWAYTLSCMLDIVGMVQEIRIKDWKKHKVVDLRMIDISTGELV
jgi:hypothetical protein